jgi:hypothetical protein
MYVRASMLYVESSMTLSIDRLIDDGMIIGVFELLGAGGTRRLDRPVEYLRLWTANSDIDQGIVNTAGEFAPVPVCFLLQMFLTANDWIMRLCLTCSLNMWVHCHYNRHSLYADVMETRFDDTLLNRTSGCFVTTLVACHHCKSMPLGVFFAEAIHNKLPISRRCLRSKSSTYPLTRKYVSTFVAIANLNPPLHPKK